MCHRSRSSTVVTPRPVYFRSSGSVAHRFRRIEAAAGFLGDPPQPRRVHRRVEVFGVARRGADVRLAGAERTCRRAKLRRCAAYMPCVCRDERAAILAVPLAGPLHRHVDDPAGRRRHFRDDLRVVDLEERVVDDVGDDRDRLARLDAIGGRVHLDRRRARRRPAIAATDARCSRASCPRADMLACICQRQESSTVNASALPRPYRWNASTGWMPRPLVGSGEQHRRARLHRP